MFRYRLHLEDGSDAGEANLRTDDPPRDEEIIAGNNQRFRVGVVTFKEEDESPFVGLLQVEAA
jgi:hypothetical protein